MTMEGERTPCLDIALIHYPVVNKTGDTIGSAVTNLDLHDIARAAKTYGVDKYYVVTPYEDQQLLVKEILEHWLNGHGAQYNPARKSALELVAVSESVEDVVKEVTKKRDKKPVILTTSARQSGNLISFGDCRRQIKSGQPTLLLFGTAHGLEEQIIKMADHTLPPISGTGNYNHLSVRSAVSVMLDRLMGLRD